MRPVKEGSRASSNQVTNMPQECVCVCECVSLSPTHTHTHTAGREGRVSCLSDAL